MVKEILLYVIGPKFINFTIIDVIIYCIYIYCSLLCDSGKYKPRKKKLAEDVPNGNEELCGSDEVQFCHHNATPEEEKLQKGKGTGICILVYE